MTAIKPIEDRNVRGVAAYQYPLNETCAVPDCFDPTIDPHHIWPSSLIGNRSWFVQVHDPSVKKGAAHKIVPHVIGLCRKHHDDAEEHRAWIKWEENPRGGMQFVWYEDHAENETDPQEEPDDHEWKRIRPLDPQPALGQKAGKRPRQPNKKGPRKNWNVPIPPESLASDKPEFVPGAEILDEMKVELDELMGYKPTKRKKFDSVVDAYNLAILYVKQVGGI